MKKFKVIKECELVVMYTKKEFIKGSIVNDSIYTNTYPSYFKEIGEEVGYYNHLGNISFIEKLDIPELKDYRSNIIDDFLHKEEKTIEENIYEDFSNEVSFITEEPKNKPIEVSIDELTD